MSQRGNRGFPVNKIDTCPIEVGQNFKYLGILIDIKLRIAGQLRNNIRNASNKLFLFRKNRPWLNQRNAILVYKAIVIPYVEFGNGLLLGCTELGLNKIQRTQNKGLKIALNRGRLCRTSILHADARLAEWRCALIALNKVMFKFKDEPDFTGQVRDRPNTRLTEGTTIYVLE